MKISFANTDEELLRCRAAVRELRPHITNNIYLDKCRLLLSEGAKFIFIDNADADAPAVSVFRVNYYFFRGKNLYIDDLSTLPVQRGKGYASALLDWIIAYAKANNCDTVDLDSGYWKERRDAHRLYLNKGFHLGTHHFSMELK